MAIIGRGALVRQTELSFRRGRCTSVVLLKCSVSRGTYQTLEPWLEGSHR